MRKKKGISRRDHALEVANERSQLKRGEILRAIVALTLAIALVGTGAVALPSLSASLEPALLAAPIPHLPPETLLAIESAHESAGMLSEPAPEAVANVAKSRPSAAVKVAKVTKAASKPVAGGLKSIPDAARAIHATAHEAIKMKKGIIPLIPSKFARAEAGVRIPVSLTQYCVQGETRRGRQTRHGIVAADPRIFPLARYVEIFLDKEYLGRYLVDDTGGNVLGATLDIWNPDCKEAARFGRHWGSAILVAREVEQIPNDSLTPVRWDGLAKR